MSTREASNPLKSCTNLVQRPVLRDWFCSGISVKLNICHFFRNAKTPAVETGKHGRWRNHSNRIDLLGVEVQDHFGRSVEVIVDAASSRGA
jgi:hypothetical protein